MVRTANPELLPRILNAAADLFTLHNFAAVRMVDIARRAKVAKGTLYLHFPDKESLFREIVTHQSGQILDRLESRWTNDSPVEQRLRELIQASVDFSDRYPHYLATLHVLDSAPPRAEDQALNQRRQRLSNLISDLLSQGNTQGLWSANPQRATLALLGTLHRVMQGTPRPWPSDLADWITDQFLQGIVGHPPGLVVRKKK